MTFFTQSSYSLCTNKWFILCCKVQILLLLRHALWESVMTAEMVNVFFYSHPYSVKDVTLWG